MELLKSRKLKVESLYTPAEIKLLKKLDQPNKIQDYLNTLKFNFEKNGETCKSPRFVMQKKMAHCMEAAMLAAAILEFHGHKPWVVDLRSIKPDDDDHVIAVFKKFGCFGAISKTNHGVLRYREPIYKTVRELALSYFHEYFLKDGRKTLREFSQRFDLSYFDRHQAWLSLLSKEGKGEVINWRVAAQDLFFIPRHLDKIKHYKILTPAQTKNLRKADKIEIQAGEIVEWKKKGAG